MVGYNEAQRVVYD